MDIPKVAPSHAEAQWPVATLPHLPLRGQRRNCHAKSARTGFPVSPPTAGAPEAGSQVRPVALAGQLSPRVLVGHRLSKQLGLIERGWIIRTRLRILPRFLHASLSRLAQAQDIPPALIRQLQPVQPLLPGAKAALAIALAVQLAHPDARAGYVKKLKLRHRRSRQMQLHVDFSIQ